MADAYYQESASLAEDLIRLDDTNVEANRDLAVCLSKCGDVAVAKHLPEKATDAYNRAIQVLKRLVDRGLAIDESRSEIQGIQERMSRVRQKP